LLAYELRKQKVPANIICMITEHLSDEAKKALSLIFDHVIDVQSIYVPRKRRQQRQDRPYMFTRFNALRLGSDGDLVYNYDKIVIIDADVLPIENYNDLLDVDAPARILNESRSQFMETKGVDRSKITK